MLDGGPLGVGEYRLGGRGRPEHEAAQMVELLRSTGVGQTRERLPRHRREAQGGETHPKVRTLRCAVAEVTAVERLDEPKSPRRSGLGRKNLLVD